jgi:hypothetical protein
MSSFKPTHHVSCTGWPRLARIATSAPPQRRRQVSLRLVIAIACPRLPCASNLWQRCRRSKSCTLLSQSGRSEHAAQRQRPAVPSAAARALFEEPPLDPMPAPLVDGLPTTTSGSRSYASSMRSGSIVACRAPTGCGRSACWPRSSAWHRCATPRCLSESDNATPVGGTLQNVYKW